MGDKYVPSQAHRPRRNSVKKLEDLNADDLSADLLRGAIGTPDGGMRGSDTGGVEDPAVRSDKPPSSHGNYKHGKFAKRTPGSKTGNGPNPQSAEASVLMAACGMGQNHDFGWSCAGPFDQKIYPMGEYMSGTDGGIRYYFFKTMAARDKFSRAIYQELMRKRSGMGGGP